MNFKLKPPKAAQLNENDVEDVCLDALRLRGWRPERLQAGLVKSVDSRRFIRLHDRGTPDYVVTHPAYPAFYLEIKRPGKTPTPEQQQKHAELRLWKLAVVTVDGYEALMAWLQEYERKTEQLWHERDR